LLELFTDPSQGRNTPINRLNYLLPTYCDPSNELS
jgi:hypothetical protein